jgi:hypothetical protein
VGITKDIDHFFNNDRRLTFNSLTLLQPSGGGDDEGFYQRDGVLVLGIDRI